MLIGAMRERVDPSSRPPAEARAELRRSLIGWTLAYWAVVYLLLTLRSFAVGYPNLLAQAALRIAMVLLGLAACGAIHALLSRLDRQRLPIRIAAATAGSALATLVFSAAAYTLYVLIPGIWQVDYSMIAGIGYYSYQFIWIFPTWILIYFYLRHRADATRPPMARAYAHEFWARHLGRQVRVSVDDVEWIEAEGDYVRLHIADRSYLIRSTMGSIARRLDPSAFVRIHRRSIVARRNIVCIRRTENGNPQVELTTGTLLAVGRSFARSLKPNADN